MIGVVASSIVDVHALWKILAVSVLLGAGVVGAFGWALIGVSRYRQAEASGTRAASGLLIGLAGGLCLAAVVVGLIAMTHK